MPERPCVYCRGRGCEECDYKGTRYRETWTTPGGVTLAVSGSGSFDPETRSAFEALADAAARQVSTKRRGAGTGDAASAPAF